MKVAALLMLSVLSLAGSAQAAHTDWDGKRAQANTSDAAIEQAAALAPGLPPQAHKRQTIDRGLILAERQLREDAQLRAVTPRPLY